MADQELEQIRQQRLAQMESQFVRCTFLGLISSFQSQLFVYLL